MTLPERKAVVALRLREAREYLGMSQEQVASVLGLSRPAVTNIENGEREVKALELDELARLYGRPVSYFLDGDNERAESDRVQFVARKLNGLSETDLKEVARFADFLRASPKKRAR
jgi:transcriptional regulator with XRE-family HTH domain